MITDRTSLSRTTGSVILGIEVDNQWLACKIRTFHLVAVCIETENLRNFIADILSIIIIIFNEVFSEFKFNKTYAYINEITPYKVVNAL